MTDVWFKRQVQQDIARILEWYDEQQPGLGDRFVNKLGDIVDFLAVNPLAYPISYSTFRVARLKNFPYQVFYKAYESKILIYGIFHTRRNPHSIRGSLSRRT
ncbi:MAG: type II toxin-antitoxin system RelE/ParE family toxin [Cyclobacteriaceae bacterium]|jgi:plasmid stabilization system protein ParE